MADEAAVVEARFLSSLPEGALLFRRMVAREELGRLPEYRVELLRDSKSVPIVATDLLGAKASVELAVGDKQFRYFSGFVTRFEHGGVVGRFDIYRVELRPWLWHLTLGADCRIFQDMTVVEVIKKVFADYSSAGAIEQELKATYRQRPFTVQYRESDYDFISRLMEEEGLYHYFKHTKNNHTLVLCDNPGAHDKMPGEDLMWSTKRIGTQDIPNIVTRWNSTHKLASRKYTHTDYAAESPTSSMLASAVNMTDYPQVNSKDDLEVFDYPGGYDDIAMKASSVGKKIEEGKRLAQRRVDAFESTHVTAQAVSPYRQVAVGTTFELKDHTESGGWLITRADYELEFDGYEAESDTDKTGFTCRFDAVPKTVRYQPLPVTPRPLISGPQTATVVGVSGDEITTDEYGRIRLRFRWDRIGANDDSSPCWVRVSQPWAGKQFGAISLPRVGDEVVVEFLEGNPDRPLVTGRVYNKDNMPPYKLPEQKTVTGIKTQSTLQGSLQNFNELRFDDKKGSEYVWFQAEKDYHQWVKNDAYATIVRDLWTVVKRDSSHQVDQNYTLLVKNKANLKVDADTYAKIGGDLTMAVTGATGVKMTGKVAVKGEEAVALAVGAGLDIDVGAALKMTTAAAFNAKGMSVVIEGATTLTIKAGPSFISLGPAGVVIEGPIVKINCGGAGGSAAAADKAAPADPVKPVDIAPNTDPIPS